VTNNSNNGNEDDNDEKSEIISNLHENPTFPRYAPLHNLWRLRLKAFVYTVLILSLVGIGGYVVGGGIIAFGRIPMMILGIPSAWIGAVLCGFGAFLVISGIKQRSESDTRISYWVVRHLDNAISQKARYIYRRGTLVFVVGSIFVVALLVMSGAKATVIATTFYATLLFLNETLLSDNAMMEFVKNDKHHDRDSDEDWITRSIGVQNQGNGDASSTTIQYRVYDKSGKPLTDVGTAAIAPEHIALGTGNMIPSELIFTPLPAKKLEPGESILIHLKAEDGFGYSIVAARYQYKTTVAT